MLYLSVLKLTNKAKTKIWASRTFSLNRYKYFTEEKIEYSSRIRWCSLLPLFKTSRSRSRSQICWGRGLFFTFEIETQQRAKTPPSCLLIKEVAASVRTITKPYLHITGNYFAGYCFDWGCRPPSGRQEKSLTQHSSNYCKSHGNDCQKLHLTGVFKNPNRGTNLF